MKRLIKDKDIVVVLILFVANLIPDIILRDRF